MRTAPSLRSPCLSHRNEAKLSKGTLQECLTIVSVEVQSPLCYKTRRNPKIFQIFLKADISSFLTTLDIRKFVTEEEKDGYDCCLERVQAFTHCWFDY